MFKRIREKEYFNAAIMVIAMLLILVLSTPQYLSATNLFVLAQSLTVTAVIAFAQMATVALGGMNLSIGSIGALAAVLSGAAMEGLAASTPVAILVGLLVGLFCGLLNGILIYRAGGVGSAFFLTTLATTAVFTGINLMITSGKPFYQINRSFVHFATGKALGLPLYFYAMLAVAALLHLFFTRSNFGRQVLAFGANHRAAELYGVSKLRLIVWISALTGLLAALAGLFSMMRIEAAQPQMGQDWMLVSFAAPLLGGTRLQGGKASVLGGILGAFILTMITNALVFLKVDTYLNQLFYGLILLLASSLEMIRNRSRQNEHA